MMESNQQFWSTGQSDISLLKWPRIPWNFILKRAVQTQWGTENSPLWSNTLTNKQNYAKNNRIYDKKFLSGHLSEWSNPVAQSLVHPQVFIHTFCAIQIFNNQVIHGSLMKSVMSVMLNDEYFCEFTTRKTSHTTILSQPEPEYLPTLSSIQCWGSLVLCWASCLSPCYLPSSPLLLSPHQFRYLETCWLVLGWTIAFPILFGLNLNRTYVQLYLKLWQESRLQFLWVTKVVFSDPSPHFCLSHQVRYSIFLFEIVELCCLP